MYKEEVGFIFLFWDRKSGDLFYIIDFFLNTLIFGNKDECKRCSCGENCWCSLLGLSLVVVDLLWVGLW